MTPLTPQLSPEAFALLGGHQLGYVRPVKAEQVVGDTAVALAQGFEAVTPDQTVYAVHGANGERLAVMVNRESAIAIARANDMALLAVH